jgi:hypothetical protein
MDQTQESLFQQNLSSIPQEDMLLQQNLSAILLAAVSAATHTPQLFDLNQTLLSALQQLSSIEQITQLDSFIDNLPSIPLHPYQKLIWQHFPSDYKFKTIDDVPEPESIPVQESLEFLTKKEKEISKTMFHNLTCCPEHFLRSGFEVLSGDEIVCDIDRQKNYLEFIEMIRQIPVESITEKNCSSLTKKILSEYFKVV